MSGPVKVHCHCGHLEEDHTYRDTTPEKLLEDFAKNPEVTIIHDPDSTQHLGYKTAKGTYFTRERALEEIKNARDSQSYCRPNMFEKTCGCNVYRPDNLKYLEDLSREHPAS